MEIISGIAAARVRLAEARAAARTIGLVPTMGALHEGHGSLIRRAREDCGFVVVTVFVNPTQFGPGEDFARYPRDLEADARLCERSGADLILAPPVDAVYPTGAATWVRVDGLSERFEGAARPTHFRGVATVVTKLFNMTHPDRAYFGSKDYQQLQVIRRLARDLDFPLEVIACPTVREPDGLAMSSRNRYLDVPQRQAALAIWRGLESARAAFAAGDRDADRLAAACREVLDAEPGLRPDYAAVVDAETLTDLQRVDRPAVLLTAAWVGSTRLIDNVLLADTAG